MEKGGRTPKRSGSSYWGGPRRRRRTTTAQKLDKDFFAFQFSFRRGHELDRPSASDQEATYPIFASRNSEGLLTTWGVGKGDRSISCWQRKSVWEVHGLQNTLYSPKFAVSLPLEFCSFAKFYSHATSCAPCAKTKAACKPFDADRARAKARVEAVQRS